MKSLRILLPLAILLPLVGFLSFRQINSIGATEQLVATVSNDPSPALIRDLIARGANVNATDSTETPLIHLLVRNYYPSATLPSLVQLLDAGADVDTRDQGKRTPLMVAVEGHLVRDFPNNDVIDLLLKRGADPNARSAFNQTPLTMALVTRKIGAKAEVWNQDAPRRETLAARLKKAGAK